MRTITTALTMTLAALVLATSAGATAGRSARPMWLPDMWWRLAVCETGGNWRHDSGRYEGAFGFYEGTWDTYRLPGFPADAHRATPKQQYRVALAVASRHSMYAWGCYRVIR